VAPGTLRWSLGQPSERPTTLTPPLAAKALVFCGLPLQAKSLTTITREAQIGADTHLTFSLLDEPSPVFPSLRRRPRLAPPGSPPSPTTPAASTSPA